MVGHCSPHSCRIGILWSGFHASLGVRRGFCVSLSAYHFLSLYVYLSFCVFLTTCFSIGFLFQRCMSVTHFPSFLSQSPSSITSSSANPSISLSCSSRLQDLHGRFISPLLSSFPYYLLSLSPYSSPFSYTHYH